MIPKKVCHIINPEFDTTQLGAFDKLRYDLNSDYQDLDVNIDMYLKLSDTQDKSKIIEKHSYQQKIDNLLSKCKNSIDQIEREYKAQAKKKKANQNQKQLVD